MSMIGNIQTSNFRRPKYHPYRRKSKSEKEKELGPLKMSKRTQISPKPIIANRLCSQKSVQVYVKYGHNRDSRKPALCGSSARQPKTRSLPGHSSAGRGLWGEGKQKKTDESDDSRPTTYQVWSYTRQPKTGSPPASKQTHFRCNATCYVFATGVGRVSEEPAGLKTSGCTGLPACDYPQEWNDVDICLRKSAIGGRGHAAVRVIPCGRVCPEAAGIVSSADGSRDS